MKVRRGLGIALFGAALVVLSCSADRRSVPIEASADASVSMSATTGTLVESGAAATRIAELRRRFRLPVLFREADLPRPAHAGLGQLAAPTTRPALCASVATRFEVATGADAATHVRAVLPTEALRGVSRAAHVALPLRANGEVKLEDQTSHLSVRFALEHVQDAHVELAGGMALYRGALDGADVVHRVHAEGTEDFVVFETRPAREELSYSVDVSRVRGLRLVSNTLEFLDETGAPMLRVAPPYVVDANRRRHEAQLAVQSCAYDTNPAGPWGRKVTKPGVERCTVRVVWAGDIAYPAMVDPAWGSTGSMATARYSQTASVLPSGKVLIAGGSNGNVLLASAELYDPAGNGGAGTFAATGSMAHARSLHTASVLPSGKVLVAGGDGDGVFLASAELYDPAGNGGTGTFAATGSMSTVRVSHTASVLPSGKVLVAGGGESPGLSGVPSAELFDPAGNGGAGTFAATGSMANPRTHYTASVLPSGKVLVAGGVDASAELFDPAGNAGAGAFAATGSMATVRFDHTASVLPSGKVLVVGGTSDNSVAGSVASAELYDPAGNAGVGAFAPTGSMDLSRFDHTASVLSSGKVLVVGGVGGLGSIASAELYDPAGNAGVGAFSEAGAMITRRNFHTASVLPSGKVLVTGAYGSGAGVASAELFSFVAAAGSCVAGGECLSGFCADGVCCDAACNGGGCDRCDVAGKEGTCSVMPAGDLGSNPACILPYACDGVNAGCPTKCVSSAACATGFACDTAKATCVPARATCNDHITTGADGTTHDCAPYMCDANAVCRASCTSVSDCVAPTVCDAAGKCVPAPAETGSDGGCSVVSASAADARWQLAWLAAAAGLALVRRRRRRRRSEEKAVPQ